MKINSLAGLGDAWNMTHSHDKKVKMPKAKLDTRNCGKCGMPLRQVQGTNIWMCDNATLEDKELRDNVSVQVFRKCGQVELA